MRRAKVTSDDTDNELGPAPASPRQEIRSTAHNHCARHESDSDVMPMDIDSEPSPAAVVPAAAQTMPEPPRTSEPSSPAVVPTAAQTIPEPRTEPLAPSSSPTQKPPAGSRKPRARREPLPSASSALPSPRARLPPSTSPTPPPRRTLRKRSKAQAVQDWAMCGACNCWRAIDARPTFECLDAGFDCETPCDACSSFHVTANSTKCSRVTYLIVLNNITL